MAKLTNDELQKIQQAMLEELTTTPPTIGLVGVSGVGKSSTINAMFKTNLAISHTSACTKEFEASQLKLKMKQGEVKDEFVRMVVIDAPGLGEDIKLDPEYIEQYRQNLPDSDVILWVLNARSRAMALEQMYLEHFKVFKDRIVFGLNQVDLVYPMDWDRKINLPSVQMEKNIDSIVKDRASKLKSIMGSSPQIVPYSAEKGYNLEKLFATLITTCPESRKWIFSGLKNFTYEDFTPMLLKKKQRRRSYNA